MADIYKMSDRQGRSSPNQGRAGSTRSDLALLYEYIRLRIMGLGVAISIVVGFVVGWRSGPFVQLAAGLVFLHALWLNRSGQPPGVMTQLIDGAGIALATLTISLPVVTATAFCFYTVVASVLATPRNVKWVGLFTVSWISLSLIWMQNDQREPYAAGARVIIEVATVTFFAAAITLIVAVVLVRLRRSETERNTATEVLRETNLQLEKAVESRDRLIASVSHELRTPLTAVIGLSRELSDSATEFAGPALTEIHQLIASEAEEVAHIVEDLLIVSRAEVGEVTVFPEPVDLESLVAQAVESVFGAKSTAATVGGSADAYADPIRVKQIIRNLLANAARYGGDTIHVAVSRNGERSMVEVQDNGPGIATADVEKVFEAYQRSTDQAPHTDSIGLGLAISRTLARLMNGDLSYARRGDWSIFELSLPATVGQKTELVS